MEITLKILIEVNGQPAGGAMQTVQLPETLPSVMDRFDPCYGQPPSSFLPNATDAGHRATAILHSWGVSDVTVSHVGRGWYNVAYPDGFKTVRGTQRLDLFVSDLVRRHLNAQKEPA